jgi:hypothetical protein
MGVLHFLWLLVEMISQGTRSEFCHATIVTPFDHDPGLLAQSILKTSINLASKFTSGHINESWENCMITRLKGRHLYLKSSKTALLSLFCWTLC